MSKGLLDVDCTRKCHSRAHGQALTSAVTKRSVSDTALASFIKLTCASFMQAFDYEGRTLLHMAASRGRVGLMEWLIHHSTEAFINARDRESGYTPLHRSIFYGQIHAAVGLMRIGVNTDITDKDDYKAIAHAMLDRHYMFKHDGNEPCDVYVWGSNTNYTLGTGTQQQKKTPDLLNCFSRTNSVKQVCLGKFHTVWLCTSSSGSEVYACGQLARVGASVTTSLRPVMLKLQDQCVQAAVTLDSTVLLMNNGTVLQYSISNTDNVVSQSNTKTTNIVKLPSIKPVMKLSEPLGICSSKAHCVVWNIRAVYTWGQNLGQLGHSQPTDSYVDAPKRVAISMNTKEETVFQLVGVSEAATVITTSRGDVYLLHKHICKKIAIKQINLRQVCVDAKVNENGIYSRVTVLLLTNVGQLWIWQDSTSLLTRCMFGVSHQISITSVTLTHDAMYFTTKYGEAFSGHISRKTSPGPQITPAKKEKDKNKSSLVKFLEKDDCTSVKLIRLPNIHRAVSIVADSDGVNFACLQMKPTCGLTSLPDLSPSVMSKHMETLLETTTEDDLLHDVVFKVGKKTYPAHIFIVASGSEYLYKLFQDKLLNGDVKPIIVLDNVIPEVFDRILRFLYTGTCDVTEPGPCSLKIRRDDIVKEKKEKDVGGNDDDVIENPNEISAFESYKNNKNDKNKRRKGKPETQPNTYMYCDPVKMLQASAKRLHVMALHKLCDKFYYRDGTIYLKESATLSRTMPVWDRDSFPELISTNVRTKDGIMISAHKCVLAARLEYFHGMFMNSWSESKQLSTVTLPINHGILLPVINFLYTDTCPDVDNSESLDFICSLLIVADQLFITRLREMCEVALSNMVTLKNCSELCQFAHTYNATQLKQCCMEFISLNLSSILENKSLEMLDDELLLDISSYYCNFNPIMSSRVITPFFNAPSDEVINDSAKIAPVDLRVIDEELKREEVIESAKKKRSKKIEYTENEKARKRYESVSSVDLDTSGDITLSLSKFNKEAEKGSGDSQAKWIEVPKSQQKQQKVVQARLKAISNAKDILNEIPTESFVSLSKNASYSAIGSSPTESVIGAISRLSVSPKESTFDLVRSPQGSVVISHVGPKLSQKQRKKLAMQGDSSPQSLSDFFSNKTQESSLQPKNPWKICAPPTASSSQPKLVKQVGFDQILADQKKQKDDSSRIMTKSLTLTQLEDKAIEELERFYNIHEADDELISVRRIELQVSSPQWLHTAPK